MARRLSGGGDAPSALAQAQTGTPGRRRAVWCCLFLLTLFLGAGCGGSVNPGAPASSAATPGSTTTESGLTGEQASAYVAALLPKLTAVTRAVTTIPSTCDSSNMPACQAAMQKIHDANADLETALEHNTVPACLREADSEMRASTGLMDQATHNGMNGMGSMDLAALQAMSTQFEQAGTHQSRAMDLLQHSNC